jgi:outer membrane protein OmpA-like peptidoglycan-associated protein
MRKLFVLLLLASCAQYKSPPRDEWPAVLRGSTGGPMTPELIQAKSTLITESKNPVYSAAAIEAELYDALRKPGMSVQRTGNNVLVILVRDTIMYSDAPEISSDGAETLNSIAKVLKKYDHSFIEISGYTDSMRDANAAANMSRDLASRVAVFFARSGINAKRIFFDGRGSSRPIAAQDAEGRRMNRRVEIRIAPVL